MMKYKFDFEDILIQPDILTEIGSRYVDVNPFTNRFYPLMTAPMDTVVDLSNYEAFLKNKINVVLPRTVKYSELESLWGNSFRNGVFFSLSLKEFEEMYVVNAIENPPVGNHILIDIANGHMESILTLATKAKRINPRLTIMAGNIANPQTYRKYCESSAIDYVRVGIGNGSGCLTSEQTGIGYPMASLIYECNIIKQEVIQANKSAGREIKKPVKIIADGGMKKYADIIKALALGADYVMAGGIFNKTLESCSTTYWNGIKVPKNWERFLYKNNFNLYKKFRGMSTKEVQKILGATKVRTSEGVNRINKVEYTLPKWIENFDHYLRSDMSYTNKKTLNDFIGHVDFNLITENARKRFLK
ncbi:MAG: IMP dehydrogenase [bacterium]